MLPRSLTCLATCPMVGGELGVPPEIDMPANLQLLSYRGSVEGWGVPPSPMVVCGACTRGCGPGLAPPRT